MKKQVISKWSMILVLIIGGIVNIYGQSAITFTFTGINNSDYFQLERIKVKNLTQDCDTVLYYPDTVLTLYSAGIKDKYNSSEGFRVMQNYPNPSFDATYVSILIPKKGWVKMNIADASGRLLLSITRLMEQGIHTLRVTLPGQGIFLFNACWNSISSTIRIVSVYNGPDRSGDIEYTGGIPVETSLKAKFAEMDFLFSPGDELMLIGYADTLESGLMDCPESDCLYTFQFAANIPCYGLDSLNYDGQWYHTVQIFSQCWLAENMNAGMMVPSGQGQMNNDVVEKYCMGDDEEYCGLYGGLYFWSEMMKYASVTGGQGICPDGFHVPTDIDWQVLEGAVDNAEEIGSAAWGSNGWRGTDAGGNMKQTGFDLWQPPNTGATNAFGFNAVAAGYFVQGSFWGPMYKAYFWSSNSVGKYYRNMDWNQVQVQRNTGGNGAAFSVRCIKD